jgi:hypothetical protein
MKYPPVPQPVTPPIAAKANIAASQHLGRRNRRIKENGSKVSASRKGDRAPDEALSAGTVTLSVELAPFAPGVTRAGKKE